jgi:hypothetical protein
MKFGQKNAQMTCSLNNFLNERLLFSKIWLNCKDLLVAAVVFIAFAFLVFPTKPWMEESSFGKNSLDALWLVQKFWVIG